MRDIEHEDQVKSVCWMESKYPDHWIFAIPNGGKRNRLTAIKLKAEGVRSGVPDLFIPSLFLFIEMKKPKGGTVSENQKKWIEYLNRSGFKAVVAKGFDEFKDIIEERIYDYRMPNMQRPASESD